MILLTYGCAVPTRRSWQLSLGMDCWYACTSEQASSWFTRLVAILPSTYLSRHLVYHMLCQTAWEVLDANGSYLEDEEVYVPTYTVCTSKG